MFWEKFVSLCAEKGISPNGACAALGLSNATATKWKNGAIPRNTTLKKVADYFGVSTSYLLGATDDPSDVLSAQVISNLAASMQQVADELDKQKKPVLGLNPILSSLIDSMSKDELEDLEKYIDFLRSKRRG